MLSQEDLKQISLRGITEEQVEHQLDEIKQGFPFLKIEAAASIGKGIMSPTENEMNKYLSTWDTYLTGCHKIVKFVPASGAASRMFKNLYSFWTQTMISLRQNSRKSFLKT